MLRHGYGLDYGTGLVNLTYHGQSVVLNVFIAMVRRLRRWRCPTTDGSMLIRMWMGLIMVDCEPIIIRIQHTQVHFGFQINFKPGIWPLGLTWTDEGMRA